MTAKENIEKLNVQIQNLEGETAGLEAYKRSILEGEDYCTDYADYQEKYKLYVTTMENLEAEGVEQSIIDNQREETLSQVKGALATSK